MLQFLTSKPTFELLPELVDPLGATLEGVQDAALDEEEVIKKKEEPPIEEGTT